ncbi:MAG: NAD(P)-binding domain-containing protein [Bacteroidetes bacterium]|nr:NAD(P)-binding domain-containing protein [Bacteroidota bacterium]
MQDTFINILIYSLILIFCVVLVIFYLRRQKKDSKKVEVKIKIAKEEGLFEPVSLHPVVDVNSCIRTGACIAACPEKDILGIVNGKATAINTSLCIGHGACFHACPTDAITLYIGTEQRGVELPHISQNFETNVKGIYIAGELGGMGLIKNAVEQGKQAIENMSKSIDKKHQANYDLIIVGAGPAGISASLAAKKLNLKFLILDQDTLGGAVFTFPRSKIVMTSPMDLPLFGKVKLFETSKTELLDLWKTLMNNNGISIIENSKVESITTENGSFKVTILNGTSYSTHQVLLAIGRRGTPRKLGIPGENLEKVAYRLLEPEVIKNKEIIVVGGGDSAVESALLLAENNSVILSYRGENFKRIKPKNRANLNDAIGNKKLEVKFETNLLSIENEYITLSDNNNAAGHKIKNDLVYIFAGGELPTEFLRKAGINITKKFGEAILKHDKHDSHQK